MEESLTLLNSLVEKANLEVEEVAKIKYHGDKVWPQLAVDPNNCLQFHADDICSIYLNNRFDGDIYYMVNNDEFVKYNGGDIEFGGDLGTLYVYGTAYYGALPTVRSNSTVPFSVSGPLNSLVRWNGPYEYAPEWNVGTTCDNMFAGVTNLTDVSELGFFGSCDQVDACAGMFKGCTSLVKVPEKLTCEFLTPGAYREMFKDCTSLVKGMEFDCTSAYSANNAFSSIYEGCISLVEAPPVRTNQRIAGGMDRAFYGCTALKRAIYLEHPGLEYCYQSAFEGCTALEEVPAFLDNGNHGIGIGIGVGACYRMFADCTSLTEIHEDNFSGMLGSYAFYEMYTGCTSLKLDEIYMGTSIPSTKAYSRMFFNGPQIKEAHLNLRRDDDGTFNCHEMYGGCFSYCTDLKTVSMLGSSDLTELQISDNCAGMLSTHEGNFYTTIQNFPPSILPWGWEFHLIGG